MVDRAAIWKRAAKDYRRRLLLSREFTRQWYEGYRRAWKLDEPTFGDKAEYWLASIVCWFGWHGWRWTEERRVPGYGWGCWVCRSCDAVKVRPTP
jgi:hypothetical protein